MTAPSPVDIEAALAASKPAASSKSASPPLPSLFPKPPQQPPFSYKLQHVQMSGSAGPMDSFAQSFVISIDPDQFEQLDVYVKSDKDLLITAESLIGRYNCQAMISGQPVFQKEPDSRHNREIWAAVLTGREFLNRLCETGRELSKREKKEREMMAGWFFVEGPIEEVIVENSHGRVSQHGCILGFCKATKQLKPALYGAVQLYQLPDRMHMPYSNSRGTKTLRFEWAHQYTERAWEAQKTELQTVRAELEKVKAEKRALEEELSTALLAAAPMDDSDITRVGLEAEVEGEASAAGFCFRDATPQPQF